MGAKLRQDRRELVQQLFAEATRAVETAHAAALRGQSRELTPAEYARCAVHLNAAIGNAEALVEAVGAVLYPAEEVPDGSADGA